MDLDQKEGLATFDDGPELMKLQGWYDRVREDPGISPGDGKSDDGDAGRISTKVPDARLAS